MRDFLPTLKSNSRLLLAAGVVIATIITNVLIGVNLSSLEESRRVQHIQLTEKISQLSLTFLSNRDNYYFLSVLQLMPEMPFLRYIAVFLDGAKVLETGEAKTIVLPKELESRLQAQELNFWKGNGDFFYVSSPLNYQVGKQASLLVVYSMADIQKSKNIIRFSMTLSLILLLILVGFMLALDRTHHRLQNAEKTKKIMISAISHDAMHNIQPMVNKISEFIDQGRGVFTKVAIVKVMKNMKENLNGVIRVLENLRFNEMLAEGKVKVRRTRTDVCECIRFTLESFEQVAEDKQIRLLYYPPTAVCLAWADRITVESVLLNLVDNAVKYSSPKSVIEVQTKCEVHWVVVRVTDQGRGIPHEAWETIFDPFVRLLDEDKPVKGSGLGLANARRLIKLNNGEVRVSESRLGHGTTFELKLPRIR